MHLRPLIATPLLALLTAACSGSGAEGESFVLYRNSMTDDTMRIHAASFDASDGEKYNRENCEQAQKLFQAQPGVRTRFWCEKGRFRK